MALGGPLLSSSDRKRAVGAKIKLTGAARVTPLMLQKRLRQSSQQSARFSLEVGEAGIQGRRLLRVEPMPVHAIALPGRRTTPRAMEAADGPSGDGRGLTRLPGPLRCRRAARAFLKGIANIHEASDNQDPLAGHAALT